MSAVAQRLQIRVPGGALVVVTQGVGSISTLEELPSFFDAGRVYVNARKDNHREHLGQYIVNRRDELLGAVIPFLEAHSLRSVKQRDFEKFTQCMRLIAAGRHLERGGLIEIAVIAETMNRRTSRRELVRILRGHTPEVQDTGS
jgi:hypothetical protein